MAENIQQIQKFLDGLKKTSKDYLVHVYGEKEMIKLMVIDAESQKEFDFIIAYNFGKNFIQAFPMLFSVPFKAVILNITVYKNHGFSNNYEFCKVIREKLRRMKVPHYFICSYQLLHLSLFTIANISAKIGDKFLIFNLNPNNAYSHCKFEFTQNGFIKKSIGQVRIEKETPFSPTTINGIEANEYSKIIICNINIHCQINERLRNVLDSAGNLIVVENEQYKRTCNRFICEMAKWMMDKSAVKFHVCPYSAWKYIVYGMIGDVRHDLIKAEIGENLPFEKTIIVDKTFHSYSALSIGEKGSEVLESCKTFDKECHKIEITFKIDDEHFHTLTTKNIIIPEIQNLPKTLDEINDKSKIPVIIGFWDNSSVICVSKNGGKFKFLQNWNGLYGRELFINFSKQKPSFDSKLFASDKTKMDFVVYDIIKIMSMPSDAIKKDKKWKFEFFNDSENPILLEFDYFNGTKRSQSPAFLMALLLKEHFKAIQAEIGGEKPKEIGFYLFDEINDAEKQRIKAQLQQSCELLKIQCCFLNF